jgi:UDP-glucose 4-epimerase
VNELAAMMLEVSGSRSEVRHGPAKGGEQRRSVIDIRRAAAVFGWRPEVSLRDGLTRTVEFFRARAAG